MPPMTMTMIEISEDAANALLERIEEMQEEIHELYLVVDRNRQTTQALLDAWARERGERNVA